jgi:phenylacetic acid degradation operon negative regulatory protein
MSRKTEELLNLLFWSAETLVNPTWRNVFESYEGWTYRNGLLTQMARLEQRKWIARKSKDRRDRVYRLSARGRLEALGGRDPQARWKRAWDGRWRLIIFDIPTAQNAQRERLRRYLRSRGFGHLQNSVWITPDSVAEERRVLAGGAINVESLILLEARAGAGESDEEIVAGAWDFDLINHRYSQYLKVLNARPGATEKKTEATRFLRWMSDEREAWFEAVTNDPLLPARLLPANYLGRRAWQRRSEQMRHTSRRMEAFKEMSRET